MIEAPSFSLYQLTIPIPWRGRGYFKIWSQIKITNPRNDSNIYHYLPRMSSQYFLIFFKLYCIWIIIYNSIFSEKHVRYAINIYIYICVCVYIMYIFSLSSLSSFVNYFLFMPSAKLSDKRFCFLLAKFQCVWSIEYRNHVGELIVSPRASC